MNNKNQFDVPILFIIFRRKDTALKVIEAIAKVKPKTLYISQDGPRNREEARQVEETRKAVLTRINWKCDLTVWTHHENLGLNKHIPEAFDKFFKKEDCGIYLEDDTVPNVDFFNFQKDLLRKYENDKRIFSISGTNLYSFATKTSASYYLSKIGSCWGMGIWKRSWKLYNSKLQNWKTNYSKQSYLKYFFNREYRYYIETFISAVAVGRQNSWAFPLIYSAIVNNKLFITPTKNLVTNLNTNINFSNPTIQDYKCKSQHLGTIIHPKRLDYHSQKDAQYFGMLMKGGWARLIAIRIYLFLPDPLKKFINSALIFCKKYQHR